MHYKICWDNPLSKILKIELRFSSTESRHTQLNLAKWRPGRYEFASYAGNLYKLKAYNRNDEVLTIKRITTHSWLIMHNPFEEIIIKYDYYANILDGGGTYLDEFQLYVNPINCLLYVEHETMRDYKVLLPNVENWTLATSLQHQGTEMYAENFHVLFDSPFIYSSNIQRLEYSIDNTAFSIWIQGKHEIDKEKLVEDFIKFSKCQIDMMGSLLHNNFHFMIQILPHKFYHGVEHLNNTVLALGTNNLDHDLLYENLLGVSSHELFHHWNIKRIRPNELSPYDYQKESYFDTGYVAEGFTTYFGDLFLVRSKVMDIGWYLDELNKVLKRHFENFGRQTNNLLESSKELWIDGYKTLAPYRKVSIYNEGALFAFVLDIKIRSLSKNNKSLDDVMKGMLEAFGDEGFGYSNNDVCNIASKVSGQDMQPYFMKYLDEGHDMLNELKEVADWLGLKLDYILAENPLERFFGIRTAKQSEEGLIITTIHPNSIGFDHFSLNDRIIKINSETADNSTLDIGIDQKCFFEIERFGERRIISLISKENGYFSVYCLSRSAAASQDQKMNFNLWLSPQ